MTVDQVLKLIDAGYTAAEIKAMEDPEKKEPEKKEPEKKEPEKKEQEGSDPDPLDAIKQQIQNISDVVDKMSKVFIMPNMDKIDPLGIDDVITKFFKEE